MRSLHLLCLRCRGRWAAALVAVAVATLPAGPLPAQDDAELPEPEDVTLQTKDGVILKCTYYPGSEGKQTVPIIMLHGWEGQRGDYDALASTLQGKGHAVIVPDLRGHGESTAQRIVGLEDERRIDRDRMRVADFGAMVQQDVEAVKTFLMDKHNAGELNIDLLCVVGADMGAVIGLYWVAQDWSWPQLPTMKQGQDVKAFVLISPPYSFKGLSPSKPLRHPVVRGKLSAMIIFGKNNPSAASNAKRIANMLERSHPPIPATVEEQMEKQDLFVKGLDTTLQGTKLLANRALEADQMISLFIDWRLVNKRDKYPWTSRNFD